MRRGLLLIVLASLPAFAGQTLSSGQILYFSAKEKTAPLLVYFHGGAWLAGRKEQFADVGRAFAGRGIATAIVDYRLSTDPSVRHPAHAEDGARAVRWLAEHATELGFRPDGIVVAGHSAGAHLAATLVTGPELAVRDRIAAVVTTEGIFDVPKLAKDFPSYVDWFLVPAFGTDRKAWRAASPRYGTLAGSPPWLLLHSESDTLVDPGQSETMARALADAKVPATLERLRGFEHDAVTEALADPDSKPFAVVREFVRGLAARSGTGVRRDEHENRRREDKR